ncbi:hypothetical protein GCM10010466_35660 [Planomonospora alba]|uniref:Lipoprotein n=1 Tax=Planomonospora alba TaxID=161354 RepID=A0ABP6NC31_9ACTN
MSPKRPLAAGGILLAGLALLVPAGCGLDPQVRVERPAGRGSPAPAPAQTATGVPSDVDGLRVLRADPRMGTEVVSAIERCEGGRFPVYADEISLTGDAGSARLLVVTVFTCPGRSCGYEGTRGTYVYRLEGDRPGGRVYAHEGAGSRVEVQDGALVLVRPEYLPDDDASCPTATRTTPLRWTGGTLVPAGA